VEIVQPGPPSAGDTRDNAGNVGGWTTTRSARPRAMPGTAPVKDATLVVSPAVPRSPPSGNTTNAARCQSVTPTGTETAPDRLDEAMGSRAMSCPV
jgi:hypothetical protein